MDPITLTVITTALAQGLVQVGKKLVEDGVLDPAVEPVTKHVKRLVQRGVKKEENELLAAVREALQTVDPAAGTAGGSKLLTGNALARLRSEDNHDLRLLLAQSVLTARDPGTAPPDALVQALDWPRSRTASLGQLLAAVRAKLYTVEEWRAPLDYLDRAAELGLLHEVVAGLESVTTESAGGPALRMLSVTPKATDETRRQYLEWMRYEMLYLPTGGILQTERHVQLRLDRVYISLRAQRDAPREDSRSAYEQARREMEARGGNRLDARGFFRVKEEERLSPAPQPA